MYEYFISYFLNKSFESVFGTVTCLPGCFSMYRLSMLVSDDVVAAYSRTNIDTLHLKNLYDLGEDRLLTTFLLKFFPHMRMLFVPEAVCYTNVPATFSVLFSQRRRWINSTLHNLVELLRVPSMCGCFLFSMRTVVLLDLVSTVILPASMFYLAYLVYVFVSTGVTVSMLLIVVFAVMFGLQVAVFVFKSQWQYLLWFALFVAVGTPVFYVLLPLYAFWNSDQVSWGKTRKVVSAST